MHFTKLTVTHFLDTGAGLTGKGGGKGGVNCGSTGELSDCRGLCLLLLLRGDSVVPLLLRGDSSDKCLLRGDCDGAIYSEAFFC